MNKRAKMMQLFAQPIIYIVVVCIFIQTLIYKTVPENVMMGDSYSYVGYAQEIEILKGKIDERRTPVYPCFIKLIRKIGGDENLLTNIAIVQKCLFIVTLVMFYYCVKTVTKSKVVLSVLPLLFGISPFIILWNVTILTEAISIFEMTSLALVTLKYLKKPSKVLAGITGIIILIMVMTRPSFIYLLPIYFLFWVIRFFCEKSERKNIIIGIISSVICGLIILVYCGMVKSQYGKFGLTVISNVNNIVSVIDSDVYKNASNQEIAEFIMQNKGEQTDENICFTIYEKLAEKYDDAQLEEFVNSTMKSKEYGKYLIRKTIKLSSLNIGTSYVEKINSVNYYRDIGNFVLPITFGMVYVMIGISCCYMLWKLIKKKQIDWILAFCTILITANLFTLIVGAPFESQRLFVASIVLVLLLIAYVIENILKKGKKDEKNVV